MVSGYPEIKPKERAAFLRKVFTEGGMETPSKLWWDNFEVFLVEYLEAQAADEREACAKIANDYLQNCASSGQLGYGKKTAGQDIYNAILARKH